MGEAAAKHLSRLGAVVVLGARRTDSIEKLAKEIQENKDKANFFANKGGQMRMVAKRMREKAEELEEKVERSRIPMPAARRRLAAAQEAERARVAHLSVSLAQGRPR